MPKPKMTKLRVSPRMQRSIPVVKDIKEQLKLRPGATHAFLYDDGGVFRAFAAGSIIIGPDTVTALYEGEQVVMVPVDTSWRLVSLNSLNIVTGAEILASDLFNQHLEYKLHTETVKALGIESGQKSHKSHKHGVLDELSVPQSTLTSDKKENKIAGTGTGGQYL